jgi:HNH endonuclease
MLEYDRLVELFDLYDNGLMINRVSRGRAKAGSRAGQLDVHGYRRIVIDYVKYYEHHLVWFYVYGEWPDELDHKDGDRANNAPDNLRLCDRSQNCFNAKRETGAAGLKGAYLDKRTMNWYSHIQIGGQVIHLGMFATAMEAHLAYMAAVERYHGEFALHNRPQPSKETE